MSCSIDGCEKPLYCRGYCHPHYDKKLKSGEMPRKRRKNGTGSINKGYILRRFGKRGVLEHTMIVEKILGKRLPFGAMVHHVDGNRANNKNENLVVCENGAYHKLLHLRMEAYLLTGDPEKRKCVYCKEYDSVGNMVVHSRGLYTHKKCSNEFRKNIQIKNKAMGIKRRKNKSKAIKVSPPLG